MENNKQVFDAFLKVNEMKTTNKIKISEIRENKKNKIRREKQSSLKMLTEFLEKILVKVFYFCI